MDNQKPERDYVFGRLFGTFGFFIGAWLGYDWDIHWIGVIILGFIGAAIGLWVERIVTKVILFLLALLYLLIRNGILNAIFS